MAFDCRREESAGEFVELEVELVALANRLDGGHAGRLGAGGDVRGYVQGELPAQRSPDQDEALVKPLGDAHDEKPLEVPLRFVQGFAAESSGIELARSSAGEHPSLVVLDSALGRGSSELVQAHAGANDLCVTPVLGVSEDVVVVRDH